MIETLRYSFTYSMPRNCSPTYVLGISEFDGNYYYIMELNGIDESPNVSRLTVVLQASKPKALGIVTATSLKMHSKKSEYSLRLILTLSFSDACREPRIFWTRLLKSKGTKELLYRSQSSMFLKENYVSTQ